MMLKRLISTSGHSLERLLASRRRMMNGSIIGVSKLTILFFLFFLIFFLRAEDERAVPASLVYFLESVGSHE